MDADNQHPIGGVAALLEELNKGNANVVIGSCPERGSGATSCLALDQRRVGSAA